MLIHGLIDRLIALKLHGMAEALEDIAKSQGGADMDVEDVLTLMIDQMGATDHDFTTAIRFASVEML